MSIPRSGWCFSTRPHRRACRRSSGSTDPVWRLSAPLESLRRACCGDFILGHICGDVPSESATRGTGTLREMALVCGHYFMIVQVVMMMRNALLSRIRIAVVVTSGVVSLLAAAPAVRAAEPTAAGLWQQLEE